jgi:hypothetical protein
MRMTRKCSQSRGKSKRQSQRIRFALALPTRSKAVSEQLTILDETFRRLFADENFITLLHAESMTSAPARYRASFGQANHGNEIHY